VVVRYEAAVETYITFHTQQPPYRIAFHDPETVVIEYEGRRFVWHALGPNDAGEERWPVVTTMVADPDDYADERLAMARFLSALAFTTGQAIEVVITGGAGHKHEMDTPFVNALRRGLGNHIHGAPAEVVALDDPRLKLVLAYHREGLNVGSPFYKFLAFWNALDVACEDAQGGLRAWIRATAPGFAHLRTDLPAPDDWWTHFQNDRRSAVAHAVRDPGRGVDLDPDDPADRGNLGTDALMLRHLVQVRIRERWGDHVVWSRPRP
jgi:hypothetical protein